MSISAGFMSVMKKPPSFLWRGLIYIASPSMYFHRDDGLAVESKAVVRIKAAVSPRPFFANVISLLHP
jgi:hypothetical protein